MKVKRIRNILLKKITLLMGLILSALTIIPMPWRVRCTWARVLALIRGLIFHVYKPTSFHKYLEAQNIEFNLGKQEYGAYASFKQFESLLQFSDINGISFHQLKSILEFLEDQNIEAYTLRSFFDYIDRENISLVQFNSFVHNIGQT